MKSITAASPLEGNSVDDEGLPEGWEIKNLKDITIKVPTLKPESEPERIFGYVDISAINNKTNQIFDFKKIRGADAPSRARQSIQPNDVLFSNVRTYLRNIAIIPDDLDVQVCSTGFTVLRSNGSIEPKYLFYYTLTDDFINQVTPQQTGSQYPATTDRVVKDATIPFPPLAEQQRIVARVEALLSHVDAAGDRLSRVPAIMKRFRQAVLAAACSGRLTEEWREENLHGFSDQINQKILQIMEKKKILHNFEWEENFTLPSDWILTFIEIVAKVDTGTTPSRKNADYWNNGSIPWVTSGELYDPFVIDTKEKISEIALKETRLKIFPVGTLLIALYGQGITRGKSSELLIEATTNQACGTINVFDDFSQIKPYLKLYLQKNYDDIRKLSSGGVQPNLNLSKIKSMPIALPPLSEQREIVRRVGLLFERADAIEREVAAAGRRCERLTQAVMVKAFSGML